VTRKGAHRQISRWKCQALDLRGSSDGDRPCRRRSHLAIAGGSVGVDQARRPRGKGVADRSLSALGPAHETHDASNITLTGPRPEPSVDPRI
jgi:hypothetical protein